MKKYKALVKNKRTKQLVIIESAHRTKTEFIQDLRGNGYMVNPYKVKLADVFDRIMNSTNCSLKDWKGGVYYG